MSKAKARECLKRQTRLQEDKTMLTMTKIMDCDTAEHFYAWLERTVHISEQHETEELIFALIKECPDYLVSRSWPEMRALAEATYK